MTNVLNYLKIQKIDIAKVRGCYPVVSILRVLMLSKQLTETFTVEKVKEMLSEIIKSCHEKSLQQQKTQDGHIKLERGFATIPLPGIDVPFHSRYLWAGVLPFRACEYSRSSFSCIRGSYM